VGNSADPSSNGSREIPLFYYCLFSIDLIQRCFKVG
jgi:hypothetical protein